MRTETVESARQQPLYESKDGQASSDNSLITWLPLKPLMAGVDRTGKVQPSITDDSIPTDAIDLSRMIAGLPIVE